MPKEKKKAFDEKQERSTMFYYEIIGSVIIILSITTLGKLGKVGKVLTTLLKVTFGDWYFIALLFLLFLGIYNLFLHTRFNFKDNRFVGFIFLSLTIMLFSHFSIHKYVLESDSSYLGATFDYYKNFINVGYASSLGGGLIGAIIFYIIYYLLGKIGVILLGLVLLILSVSLIFNTPFLDIGKWMGSKILGIFRKFKSFRSFFRYEVGKDMQEKRKEYVKLSLGTFKSFADDNIVSAQEEDASFILNSIKSYFDEKNIIYSESPYIISYYVSTFYFELKTEISHLTITNIFYDLKKLIKSESFFSFESNYLIIQVSNYKKRTLSVRKILISSKTNQNYIFPYGIDYQNNLITLDINQTNNLLLVGESTGEILNYLKYYCSLIFYKYKSCDTEVYLYDRFDDLSIFHNVMTVEGDIYAFLDFLIKKIDEWNESLSLNGLFDYKTYLNKSETSYLKYKVTKKFVIINVIDENVDLKYIEDAFLYITQLSKKLGITFIYSLNNSKFINNTINSMFENKIVFKINRELSDTFTSRDDIYKNALYLEGSGDAFFIQKKSVKRITTPLLSSSDLEQVNNALNKNNN